nr:VanZ family protein [Clostridium collagenovorans]
MKYLQKVFNSRVFRWILVVLWMSIIFKFSNDNASASNEKSSTVIMILNFLGIDLNSTLGEFSQLFIRKAAHITEYFILCFFIYEALKIDFSDKLLYILSILFTFFYAATDEFHQLFVVGRSGQIKDIFIDTTGAIIFLILVLIKKYIAIGIKAKNKFE